MPKNKNGLTKQQQAFADYHRSHPDEPGYKVYHRFYKVKSDKVAEVCSSKLLSNAKVKAYLERKQEIAEKKADYKEDEWIQSMLKLKRMCMAEEDILFVTERLDEKNQVVRYELRNRDFNPAGANKALETLAKKFGWLADGNKDSSGDPEGKTYNRWIIMPVRSLHEDAKPVEEEKPVIEGKSVEIDDER